MITYLAIPLTAATLLVAFGCVIMTIGSSQRANRMGALLLFAAGFWAFCEVLWNAAPDAETAAAYHRLAIPGFVFIGPLSLALVGEVTERRAAWLPRLLRVGFAVSGGFLAAGWLGPTLVGGMVRTSWGWGLVPGPLFAAWALYTGALMLTALLEFQRRMRQSAAWIDRTRGPVLVVLTALPSGVGIASDALLPLLGVQWPRVATLVFAGFGGVLLWGLHRFGYSSLPNREFARRIIRILPDALVLTSLNGRIRVSNNRLESMVGCAPGRSVGMSIGEILDVSLLDPPREVRQLQAELRRVDGQRIPVLVSSSRMRDNDERVMGLVLILSDQRELVSLRNQVVTSDRLAAVGQLAAGIAHEINNPLAFVRSNLNLLRREWGELAVELEKHDLPQLMLDRTGDWSELMDESLEGVDRAATIVRDVRDFSHAGTGGRELADLSELLDQVLRMAANQLPAGVEVERDYAAREPIHCQPQRLKQLFLNLLVNAGHAVEEDGWIAVRTQHRGDCVVVLVEDDGCGIPEPMLDRIFDPFFTTKEVGVGTGLGLAISHEIVRAHDGRISVERRPEGGTLVRVELPVAAADAAQVPRAAGA